MRYDLGQRPAEPPAGGPDVTSTGMNTFGGPGCDFGSEAIEMPVAGRPPEPRQPPRRVTLMSAFGLLTVLGAAGAYLVVVNGLIPLGDDQPAVAGTFSAVAPADSGLGPSTPLPRRHATISPPATGARTATGAHPATGAGQRLAVPVAPAAPRPTGARPIRTAKSAKPECVCDLPPVPTPTAPATAPSPTPSAPVSPTSSPGAATSDWDISIIPDDFPEPRSRWNAGHHWRRR
jgi:hypothetical protein